MSLLSAKEWLQGVIFASLFLAVVPNSTTGFAQTGSCENFDLYVPGAARERFVCVLENAGHSVISVEKTRSGLDTSEYTINMVLRDGAEVQIRLLGPAVQVVALLDLKGNEMRRISNTMETQEALRYLTSPDEPAPDLFVEAVSSVDLRDLLSSLINPYFFGLTLNGEIGFTSGNVHLPMFYLFVVAHGTVHSECIKSFVEFEEQTIIRTFQIDGVVKRETTRSNPSSRKLRVKTNLVAEFSRLHGHVANNLPTFVVDLKQHKPFVPVSGHPPTIGSYSYPDLVRDMYRFVEGLPCNHPILRKFEHVLLAAAQRSGR